MFSRYYRKKGISMFGLIDKFIQKPNAWEISGWAYYLDNKQKKKKPANKVFIELNDHSKISCKVSFFHRSDLSENNNIFGFKFENVDFSLPFLIITDQARIVASFGEDDIHVKIPIWEPIYQKTALTILGAYLDKFDTGIKRDFLITAITEAKKDGYIAPNLGTSDLLAQVGLLSYDQSASVGKKGFLFLEGGSNSVRELYKPTSGDEVKAEKWIDLIKKRHEKAESLGCQFYQMIVPEKQSILTEESPEKLLTITPILEKINYTLSDTSYFIDVFSLFRDMYSQSIFPYRKVDTHLSFEGAKRLFAFVYEKIYGSELKLSSPILENETISGDLAHRFGWGTLLETADTPSKDWDVCCIKPQLIQQSNPEKKNGVIGIFRQWECPESLSDKSILIFGNSMFERGESPFNLCWWFSRFFRKTTFSWSPTVDWGVVEQERPDFLIAQTVERFLTIVPSN